MSDADIASLKSAGVLAWLDARYNEPLGQTGVAWLDSRGHGAITTEERYRGYDYGDFMIWNQLIAGPDQMRKRMALAMSEMFVVSLSAFNTFWPAYLIAAYWDAAHGPCLRQFPPAARGADAQCRHGLLPQYARQSQGRLPWPAARRELRARSDAALHDRSLPAQSRWHAQARCRQPAAGILRPGRRHQPRARLHRLQLRLSIQWRHVHFRRVGAESDTEHALRHQPHAFYSQQSFHAGGELSRHADHGNHARRGCPAHRARPALLSRQHRPVLRAADDPAPGDQQSLAGLCATRRDGVWQQRRWRAR